MKGIAALKRKGSLVGGESGQVRKPGGGRKRIEEVAPAVERELKKILNGTTAGDPMSYLKWTNKSTRTMAAELERKGHDISHVTVGRCLREMGYSLQGNLKTIEGTQHPDRDKQFRYINKQVSKFMRSKDPVVSVDTKKKELIGAFKNGGKTWREKSRPDPVFVHDFPSMAKGKAIPYGTYDVSRRRINALVRRFERWHNSRNCRIRSGEYLAMVAYARTKVLPEGEATTRVCGCRWK